MPRPLLSEALRGHGALLRDAHGERFVDELAPRDVVSRAMAARMQAQGVESLWLDATGLASFGTRFPTIAASLSAIGLDPRTDWLPIAPAAHYLSGGVITDLWGATALPGLWAAGEVACTGVHGANRLASNSLLEGMVFGARLAESILAGGDGPSASGVMSAVLEGPVRLVSRPDAGHGEEAGERSETGGSPTADGATWSDGAKARDALQRAMTEGAGVVRSAESLAAAGAVVESVRASLDRGTPADRAAGELVNLVTVADGVLQSASVRTESRGAHARSDYPETDDQWRRRIVHAGSVLSVVDGPPAPPADLRSDDER
jgi:L-aspartate oxidase